MVAANYQGQELFEQERELTPVFESNGVTERMDDKGNRLVIVDSSSQNFSDYASIPLTELIENLEKLGINVNELKAESVGDQLTYAIDSEIDLRSVNDLDLNRTPVTTELFSDQILQAIRTMADTYEVDYAWLFETLASFVAFDQEHNSVYFLLPYSQRN